MTAPHHPVTRGDFLSVPYRGTRVCGVVTRLTPAYVYLATMRIDGGLTQWRSVRARRVDAQLGDLPHQPEAIREWVREVRARLHDGTWRTP